MDPNVEKAEEKLFSRNITKYGFDLNPVVSITSGVIILILTIYAFLSENRFLGLPPALEVFSQVRNFIVSNFDWVFILSSNLFIILCLYLAFSRLGKVRIGGLQAEPEFSDFAWYSMLISAGMGIGLMFWAVGEPLYHASITPPIYESPNPAFQAMATTFFHWGLHPWGIYAIISLALAYFAYNKQLPLSIRSVFYPIFKDRIFGTLGDIIDILAVLSCLFGLATSLGLGVQQINSGLNYLIGVPYNTGVQVVLILVITLIATISVVSGIDKGVRVLSEFNIKIALIFMTIIFLIGPTFYIIRLFANSLGLYLGDFVRSSFFISIQSEEIRLWQGSWSIFYLAWWISWSPFVGMFIARVSKGRTIRQFVLAVMIIPALLSFIWLSVFGGTAIAINRTDPTLFETVQDNLPVSLFKMISLLNIPFLASAIQVILSIVATILVISFFITSSDSGSLVVNNITSGGKLTTPVKQRVFWAFMEGLLASVLLIIGGKYALQALQAAVISTGLPFSIILIVMSLQLIKSLQKTYKRQKRIKDVNKIKDIIETTDININ